MENKEVKLSVRNLVISFKTAAGNVQAVRDISFDLFKGETLAIVGESGSGKSVTTRAILGILANNAIKEGGEIIYDGQDLMKISEEGFHKIRGDKIAMIFQDPLSSLNPIMRIGRQMTEAMLIKGKLSRKESRKDFNTTLSRINYFMDLATGAENNQSLKSENQLKCKNFDRFEYKHLELENAYNRAREAAEDALSDTEELLFEIEKHAVSDIYAETAEIIKLAEKSVERYMVYARAEELQKALVRLKELTKRTPKQYCGELIRTYVIKNKKSKTTEQDYREVSAQLEIVKNILEEALAYTKPNFFALGYYLTFSSETLPDMKVEELNKYLRKYLDEHFMFYFIATAQKALEYSRRQSIENKKNAVKIIDDNMHVFEKQELDKAEVVGAAKSIVSAVENSIDRLEIVKDNTAYTFGTSLKSAINLYFDGIKRNAKEERRYARQKAGYDRRVERGKTPDWQVADKNLVDLEAAVADIRTLINRVRDSYAADVELGMNIDFTAKTVAVIDYLKDKASNVAFKLTRQVAKTRALKLLEEVGIPVPKKRYRQYPFEFSGGMRQRIVIAIALSENPDILICDEPTTALDVTIQAQILELINKVKRERKLSVIFITHDLGVVANMADRIAVMYAGKIVEIGTAEDIFYDPRHPYTWALLSSMPDLDTKEKLEAIPGTPPNMIYPPKGDAFAERNKYAMQIDFEQQPPMFKITDTHYAATWLLHPNAPKIEPPKSVTDRIARMKARVKKVGFAQSVQSENLEEPTEERRAEHLEQESAENTGTMSETVFGGHETPGGQAMTEVEADAEDVEKLAEETEAAVEEGISEAGDNLIVKTEATIVHADPLMGSKEEPAVDVVEEQLNEKTAEAEDLSGRQKLIETIKKSFKRKVNNKADKDRKNKR